MDRMKAKIIRGSLCASLTLISQVFAGPVKPYIINGQEVTPGTYTEVVKITSETGDTCGATVVGPRTIVPAAHCVKNSKTVTFETASHAKFTADMTKSSLYPGKNHDLALGYVKSGDISGVKQMATIGGAASTGQQLTLLGFGCTRPDQPASDGKLRFGNTAILGTDSYQIKSGGTGGAILCIGDSGGPSFMEAGGKRVLVGVNAQGNMTTSNYSTRLDIPDTTSFLTTFANTNNTKICGVAGYTCDGPPVADDPSCTLKAVPNPVRVGDTLILNLTTAKAASATINGQPATVPNDQKSSQPTQDGTFTATAEVTSASGKKATCQDTYVVTKDPPPPPSNEPPKCTLTATPKENWQGDIVTLEIRTEGNVEYASIDGTPVQFPMGRKLVTAKQEGDFSVRGFARGKGGSVNCSDFYTVHKGPHPPPVPDFAAVPSHCGDNTLPTDIKRVCWAVVKKPAKLQNIRTPFAVVITNKDDTQEVLPIASRTPQPAQPGATEVTEDLNLLSGATIPTNDSLVFDTRVAKLTRKATHSRDESVEPLALTGKSIRKLDFSVQLTALPPPPEKAKHHKRKSR